MKRRVRTRPAVVFTGVAAILIAVALLALLQILQRFERDVATSIAAVTRVFADENILRTPGDPMIRFAALEDLAAKYENSGYLRGITVTKRFGGQDRIVYPFFGPALRPGEPIGDRPDPRAPAAPAAQIIPIQTAAGLLGHLHVQVDRGPITTVRVVVGSLIVLLVGSLGLLGLQFREQEHEISRTIVELDEKRRELVRLERLALAGQLSAGIFHDIRKPVLNIRDELSDAPADAQALRERLRSQVDLFFGILRDTSLERFVRREGDPEFVDLNAIIERSLALVQYERRSVHVATNLDTGLPPVFAIPVRLVQVFSNLILNAYQAMDGAGILSIATALDDRETIVVSVADTGPGIPEADVDSVFTPFFTTKDPESGTGLGLYIARDIIREAGGDISVRTSPGGTEFRVSLPAARLPHPTSLSVEG